MHIDSGVDRCYNVDMKKCKVYLTGDVDACGNASLETLNCGDSEVWCGLENFPGAPRWLGAEIDGEFKQAFNLPVLHERNQLCRCG